MTAIETCRQVFPTMNDLKNPHTLKDQLMGLEKGIADEAARVVGNLLGILGDEQAAHAVFKVFEGTPHREPIRLEHSATRRQLSIR